MKFYHKINQYILERFPVLWNLHFVWIILIGILLHLFYFAVGYGILDIQMLQGHNITSAFFENTFFWIYLIICLVVLIYMSFRYFGHNPFKHYYPLPRFYFWKVLMVLFSYALLFSTIIISFENGLKYKASHITPENEFKQDVRSVNLAYPFLFNDINDYHFLQRTYPKPFPLEDIGDFEVGWDTITNAGIKHGIDRTQPFITLEDMPFQLGYIKSVTEDSCSWDKKIDRIVDVSNVYGLSLFSLYNFGTPYVVYPENHFYLYRNYEGSNYENVNTPVDTAWLDVLKEVHSVYQQKDKQHLVAILKGFTSLCDHYQIPYQLQPDKMADDILIQDLNKRQLIRTGFYDYHTEDPDDRTHEVAVVKEGPAASDHIVKRDNREYNYSVDLMRFKRIVENKSALISSMGWVHLSTEECWFFIFLSLFFAVCFVGLKYLKMQTLLIGIVVAGILGAITGVIIFSVEKNLHMEDYKQKEFILSVVSLIICGAILLAGVISILSPKVKKRIGEFGFISTTIALGFFPILLLVFIRMVTSYSEKLPCDTSVSTMYRFEIHPVYIFLLVLLSIQGVLMLLRRLQSKTE